MEAILPNCPECESEYTYEDRGFTFARCVTLSGQLMMRTQMKKKM